MAIVATKNGASPPISRQTLAQNMQDFPDSSTEKTQKE